VRVELAGKRALDVFGARIVALNEVAVIGVHDAHERREVASGVRMKCLSQCRGGSRQFSNEVGNGLSWLVQASGFDALSRFNLGHFWPIPNESKALNMQNKLAKATPGGRCFGRSSGRKPARPWLRIPFKRLLLCRYWPIRY